MKPIDMKQFGLDDRFAKEAAGFPDFVPGRITAQERGLYRAVCERGELAAEVSGKLRFAADTAVDFPATGDFVLLDRQSDENGNAIIRHILSRKSMFVRKAAGTANAGQVVAANIDTVFLCMALNNDFNLRRMERYLSLAWESRATPVVVLTKADLCEEVPRKLAAVHSVALGTDVVVTTSVQEGGYQDILDYIRPGRTVTLIGSSGIGKSTLINRLVGNDRLETKEIRADGRGRHTTTRRELILLPGGGMVIDTPGMRELGMWDVSEGLDQTFGDVEAYFGTCRFRNCTHTAEPGCAIYAAIERGELSPVRWASYRKLKTEAAFTEDKRSYLEEKEKKFKDIAKQNRSHKQRPKP
ncbi:MAG: ribosome small subunit-dependent GTPase A [Lawsonibacter sp.]